MEMPHDHAEEIDCESREMRECTSQDEILLPSETSVLRNPKSRDDETFQNTPKSANYQQQNND
jgi:hypothetical protein